MDANDDFIGPLEIYFPWCVMRLIFDFLFWEFQSHDMDKSYREYRDGDTDSPTHAELPDDESTRD